MPILEVAAKPKVTFYRDRDVYRYGEDNEGFAPVLPDGLQSDALKHCKEVFARRISNTGPGGPGNYVGKGKTVKFLWRGAPIKQITPDFATRKAQVLNAFEKRMEMEPLSTCEVVKDGGLAYLLFEVPVAWKSSIPLAHVLALLVRSHYDFIGKLPAWNRYLDYLKETYDWEENLTPAIKEIVRAGGALGDFKRKAFSGISDYAQYRREEMENAR